MKITLTQQKTYKNIPNKKETEEINRLIDLTINNLTKDQSYDVYGKIKKWSGLGEIVPFISDS